MSGGKPFFWFQCRFGLALTSGLKQKAKPDEFLLCAVRVRRDAAAATTGVLFHPCDDSEEYPLAEGDRSQSASDSAPLSGDIPRSTLRQGLRVAVADSSMENNLDCFFRRAGNIFENQEGDDDEDGTLGSEFNLSDLDLNMFEKMENLVCFFLQDLEVVKVDAVVVVVVVELGPGPT